VAAVVFASDAFFEDSSFLEQEVALASTMQAAAAKSFLVFIELFSCYSI